VQANELAAVMAKVDELHATCNATVGEKQNLQDTVDTTAKRLVCAGKLTSGLAEEAVRAGGSRRSRSCARATSP